MDSIIHDLTGAIDFALGGGRSFGTGVCYYNDLFEVHGYWQHEDDGDGCKCSGFFHAAGCATIPPLFHHYESGYKARWYKRIARSFEDNGVHIELLDKYQMTVEMLESVRDDPKPEWRCKIRE